MTPAHGVGEARAEAGLALRCCAEMREAERDVARLVLRREPATAAVTGSGAYRSRNQSSDRKVPSPSTDSRKDAIAKSGSSTSVLSDAWPPTVERPSSRRLSRARRVNTSMWRASSAAWMASSCITSRKCGCSCAMKRLGTISAAVSFSIEVRHDLHDGVLDIVAGSSNGASHGIAVAGSHCAATACW